MSIFYTLEDFLIGIDNFINGLSCEEDLETAESEGAAIYTYIGSLSGVNEPSVEAADVKRRSILCGYHVTRKALILYPDIFILEFFQEGLHDYLLGTLLNK